MLLAVDIGNTSTKFGIFDGDRLSSKFSIPTDPSPTKENLFSAVRNRLPERLSDAIVCSVVPAANASMIEFLRGLTDHPVLVSNDLDFGLRIDYEPLAAIGTDRIVNSFAAADTYGAPCIVCSFGTATTIDMVNKGHDLIGGVIAPGMNTMAKALYLSTAKLPDVVIENPQCVVGNTTVSSIRSGIFYGYVAMVDGLIRRIKKETDPSAKVIATGGFASQVAEHIYQFDVVDENLTLIGLCKLYRRLTAGRTS